MSALIISSPKPAAIPFIDEVARKATTIASHPEHSAKRARLDFVQHCCGWANLSSDQAEEVAALEWGAWLDRLTALKASA
jgi:hypothetical protein